MPTLAEIGLVIFIHLVLYIISIQKFPDSVLFGVKIFVTERQPSLSKKAHEIEI